MTGKFYFYFFNFYFSLLFYFNFPDRLIYERTDDEFNQISLLNETRDDNEDLIQPEFNFDINAQPPAENSAKVDADYQKKFGRLYKTFDVRYLKGKIWETINEVN
jgi:hypothetical protein